MFYKQIRKQFESVERKVISVCGPKKSKRRIQISNEYGNRPNVKEGEHCKVY